MPEENKKKKSKKGVCEYHLCKKETEVYQCPYCGRFFCEKHIKPKPPGLPRFKSNDPSDIEFMREWRNPSGHPCPGYVNHGEKEIQKKKEEYYNALERLLNAQKTKEESNALSGRSNETRPPAVPEKYRVKYIGKRRETKSRRKAAKKKYKSNQETQENKIKKEDFSEESSKNASSMKKKSLYVVLITLILITVSIILILSLKSDYLDCNDGTRHNHCSITKPLFCWNGTLINNSQKCGCPNNYKVDGLSCTEIKRCDDGTEYNSCSKDKPFYCLNGTLVKKASICGCDGDYIPSGYKCVSKYETNPKNHTFEYVLRGEVGNITLTLYGGLKQYLSNLPRTYYCNPECPSDRDIILKYLNEPIQKKYLSEVVNLIKSKTDDPDDQARIAISFVQKIPYDTEGAKTDIGIDSYPYEVLYDNKGVCGEKSKLLAFILRELGYGVVLFQFDAENHTAVGVKCPKKYSYRNTGYCFIESANPTIPTYSEGDYVNVGELKSFPKIIIISDGRSFESIDEEVEDAYYWSKIENISKEGRALYRTLWYKWKYLVRKYGIEINEN